LRTAAIEKGQQRDGYAKQTHSQQGKTDSRIEQQQVEGGVHQLKDYCRADDQQQSTANSLYAVLNKLIFQYVAKAHTAIPTALLRQQQSLLTLKAHRQPPAL